MNQCYIVLPKFYGTVKQIGFYQIQNNCLLAFYFKKNTKVEYFYNLSELKITKEQGQTALLDAKTKIKFIVNERVEQDSVESFKYEDSDKFFDFEPNGYQVYDSELQTPYSFKEGGVLRYFDE
ncbi:Hypothetical_protein [Hexamita inflata]|uniref:Hypothetical_protein n=1 Tax=Hexamita inflata TaxID=28002 RepID=A0ABP1JI43_9EUKA